MIGSLNIGGSQKMILNLYKAIDKSKIRFDFIVDHPDQMYLSEMVESLGGRIYVMPTYNGFNIYKIKRAWNEFFKEHTEYTILHSHVRSYASLYLPIAQKYGVKTIIHSHSNSNGSGVRALVKKILQYPLRYQADYFFGCSDDAGRWLFGDKILKSNRYQTIKNTIDVDAYRFNSTVRVKYRRDLSIENKLAYIHVGRLHTSKNHKFLIGLFSKLYSKNPNSVLILVGDGDKKKDIESYIHKFNLNDSVLVLGARNDVSNLLQAADIFLFPSIWEGFPMTVVEALAAGLPCFVSNSVPSIVGVSSLIQYLSIENGFEEWIHCIENSDLRRKVMADNLKEAGFDVRMSAEEMEKFYLKFVSSRTFPN